jgi:hypothetical protein
MRHHIPRSNSRKNAIYRSSSHNPLPFNHFDPLRERSRNCRRNRVSLFLPCWAKSQVPGGPYEEDGVAARRSFRLAES